VFDSNASTDKSFKFKIGKAKVIKVRRISECKCTTGVQFASFRSLGVGGGDGGDGKGRQTTIGHSSGSCLWISGTSCPSKHLSNI